MADREIRADLSCTTAACSSWRPRRNCRRPRRCSGSCGTWASAGCSERFAALLMGRAKTWSFERPNSPQEGARYAAEQREAVLRAMAAYAPDTMIVFDVDLGHTDPQLVIPTAGWSGWTVRPAYHGDVLTREGGERRWARNSGCCPRPPFMRSVRPRCCPSPAPSVALGRLAPPPASWRPSGW